MYKRVNEDDAGLRVYENGNEMNVWEMANGRGNLLLRNDDVVNENLEANENLAFGGVGNGTSVAENVNPVKKPSKLTYYGGAEEGSESLHDFGPE